MTVPGMSSSSLSEFILTKVLALALVPSKQSPVLILALWNELPVGMVADDAFSGHQNPCAMTKRSCFVQPVIFFV